MSENLLSSYFDLRNILTQLKVQIDFNRNQIELELSRKLEIAILLIYLLSGFVLNVHVEINVDLRDCLSLGEKV